MEEDECSDSRTATTSTEMSVVEKHLVVLRLTGENMETTEEETKIKGYRLKTLKKILKSQLKGDIKWLRPNFMKGKGTLKRNIQIMDQETIRIDLTIQIEVKQSTNSIVRWLSPPSGKIEKTIDCKVRFLLNGMVPFLPVPIGPR